eukprot:9312194-Karenia_brevis.AAC.1
MSKALKKVQLRGIRQGCPLYPYLLLLVMTCIFRDVDESLDVQEGYFGTKKIGFYMLMTLSSSIMTISISLKS